MSPFMQRRLAFLLLAGLVVLTWLNGLGGEFTYDDKLEVVGNRTIRTLENWSAVLAYNASRPAVILTWALDWRLWGLDPWGYHAVNVAIHAVNAMLALVVGEEVLRRLSAPRPLLTALVAAAIWSVHPMTTEAVTYITGRSEALCATFYLGSVLGWLRWRRGAGRWFLLLSFFSFLMAAFTKEVAATLPVMLLLVELVLPRAPRDHDGGATGTEPPARTGRDRRDVALALAPFFAMLAAGAALRKLTYGVFTTTEWLRPGGVQLRTQAEVVVRYVKLWLVPAGQSVFHDHPAAETWGPATVVAVFLLAGAVGLAVALLRRQPAVPFVVGWFLLVLMPSSSLVPLKETMAEHRAYLSGWSLCLGAALLGMRLAGGKAARLLLPATMVVLLLAGLTHLRNRTWATEVALWGDAVQKNPSSAEAWYGLGEAQRFASRFQEAVRSYQEALDLDPDYLDARNNLGICLAELGHAAEAEATWLGLLRSHPSYCKAHNNLAWLYYRRREWQAAIGEFRSTLKWCPDDLLAHLGLGHIYYGPRRDGTRAAAHYQRVLDLDPEFKDASRVRERLLELTW